MRFNRAVPVLSALSMALLVACNSNASTQNTVVEVAPANDPITSFVTQEGTKLMLDGKEYRIAGTNNYYMHYGERSMITDVLDDAVALGINTIRVWGFMDGVNHDHTMQAEPGVYKKDGALNSYDKLDFTVAEAKKRGIRVVIAFTNNWGDFGGMPKYVEWFKGNHHDDFYKDPKIKECYKAYVNNLVNHKNKFTGIVNKDEPTIMTWELANEPRAQSDKSGDTLYKWAKEMSDYVRSVAPNQLIALGTEGFFRHPESPDWAYNGNDGVDWDRNITLPNINYGTLHLYPETWLKPAIEQWGTQWIKDHANAARKANKPAVLEEYGVTATAPIDRAFVYKKWTDVSYDEGLAGTMFWILTSSDPTKGDRLYPDYDGFRVLNDKSLTSQVLTEHNLKMRGIPVNEPARLFIASPVQDSKVNTENVVIKTYPTSKSGDDVNKVTIRNLKTNNSYDLSDSDGDGYYEVSIPTASLGYGPQKFVALADFKESGTVKANLAFETFQKIAREVVLTKYDFADGTTQGWEAEGTWQAKWKDGISVSDDLGKPMLKVSAILSGGNDWEEVKFRNTAVRKLASCNQLKFTVYIPTANVKKGGVRHYAAYGDGWVKLDADKNNKGISELEKVTMNGIECYKQEVTINLIDASKKKPDVFICLVGNKMAMDGAMYVSDIEFYEPEYEK
ncbi:MAG: cellulase family glycosylhydrolase [Succinivibrio sp.]